MTGFHFSPQFFDFSFQSSPATLPSGRARNIGLSYFAGDLKIIQARRSMHHGGDVNPGGGRKIYVVQRLQRFFNYNPIISNICNFQTQYNNTCIYNSSTYLGENKLIICSDGPSSTKMALVKQRKTISSFELKQGSLYYQPKQSIIVREIPQNYNTFASSLIPTKWVT